MKPELQTLLESWQQELDFLQEQLQSSVAEGGFLAAEAYREALTHTREQLRVLQNLKNPNHDKIDSLRKHIDWMKNIAGPNQHHLISEHTKAYESQLTQLQAETPAPRPQTKRLNACLEQLLSGHLHRFELEFEHEYLRFEFFKTDQGLRLNLVQTRGQALHLHTDAGGRAELKNMGFELQETRAAIRLEPHPTAEEVQQLLSRIIFGIFRLYGGKKAVLRLPD